MINNLSKKIILLFGSCALTIAAGYCFDIKNLQRIKIAKPQIHQINNYAKPIASYSALLHTITNASRAAKITLISLQPENSSIHLTLQGQYPQIINFINSLAQSTRLIVFDNLILQLLPATLTSNNNVLMQTQLTAYEIKNTTTQITSARDIFSQSITTKNPSINNLGIWAGKEMHMLGTIQKNDKMWAIIIDPLGVIHNVTCGDKIGIKQSEIINITANSVITENPIDDIKT